PYILADVDRRFYDSQSMPRSRIEVAEAFIRYAEGQLQKGVRLQNMTRHILGLFHGQPGGRLWRRILSEKSPRKGAGVEVIVEALQAVLEQKSSHQVGEID
ncbi:MAG: tRNA dihydrouridine(20/20a) synthase DusA, partial [Phototrophicales bacterium]